MMGGAKEKPQESKGWYASSRTRRSRDELRDAFAADRAISVGVQPAVGEEAILDL
jgi:hypothetical protein